MSPRARFVLALVSCGALLTVGTVGTAAAVVYRAGLLRVSVQSKTSEGVSLSFAAPAALVPAALALVPDDAIPALDGHARAVLPIAARVLANLRDQPDAVFVEARSRGEWVRVSKRGRSVLIEADDAEQRVRVEVPLGAIDDVLARFGRSGGGRRASTS